LLVFKPIAMFPELSVPQVEDKVLKEGSEKLQSRSPGNCLERCIGLT